tara:strand:+ start:344 stop:898 length:555 start_codon:yes stop_codon:yes gene_type:complete
MNLLYRYIIFGLLIATGSLYALNNNVGIDLKAAYNNVLLANKEWTQNINDPSKLQVSVKRLEDVWLSKVEEFGDIIDPILKKQISDQIYFNSFIYFGLTTLDHGNERDQPNYTVEDIRDFRKISPEYIMELESQIRLKHNLEEFNLVNALNSDDPIMKVVMADLISNNLKKLKSRISILVNLAI